MTFAGFAAAAEPNGWTTVSTPSPGPPTIVGRTAHGCIGGAAALPVDGVGYQALRPGRRRNFGHPATVRLVEALGRHAASAGYGLLLVADMGQPRGGPMPSGHASHQSGLDVDIWFRRTMSPLSPAERAEPLAVDMLRPDGKSVDPQRFGAAEIALLRFAASRPETDRVLVNPAIKRALCERVTGDRRWLRRVRPWWGHSMHFHVRIACPAGQAMCEDAPPPPPGDGCDKDLLWWFSADAARALAERLRPREPQPPKPLPPACEGILAAK
ncbi:MAG: penicillin-insensitive murein endopeptidase [Alphaproteobacteria bacterium]|nr:penicillin-insensitive murein endopeptidase [Alphaproteobacteria bacterium]